MPTPEPPDPHPAAPPALRRVIAGPLRLDAAGTGLWRVTAPDRPRLLVYLRDPHPTGAGAPCATQIEELDLFDALAIDWNGESDAALTFQHAARSLTITAAAVTLHEPIEGLYAALPLASFDAAARRFWWRIFRIVRWPGGRRLLSFIARRR